MKLEEALQFEEKTLDNVLGFVKPTLEQVLGLDKMPVSHNITPPEPEVSTEPKKPTIMDRLKGIKDKVLDKKDSKKQDGYSNTHSSEDMLDPSQDPARVLARRYMNSNLVQDNLGIAKFAGHNFEPNRKAKPKNVLLPPATITTRKPAIQKI